MLSIVAFHVEMQPVFGVAFGLNALQVVMCALAARGVKTPQMGAFARKRALRFLAPFAFWSLVYVALEVLLAWRYQAPLSSGLHARMWLMGGSFHLWFLPFAFAVSLLVYRVAAWCQGARLRPAIAIAALIGSACVVWSVTLQSALQLPTPLDLWLDGAGAVAFGFALGRALTIGGAERWRWLALIVGLALLPLALGASVAPHSALWARYAWAVPIACAGFVLPLPNSRILAQLSSYNLGLYAVHMLAIRVVDRLPLLQTLELWGKVLAITLLSLLCVVIMRRAGLRHVV